MIMGATAVTYQQGKEELLNNVEMVSLVIWKNKSWLPNVSEDINKKTNKQKR